MKKAEIRGQWNESPKYPRFWAVCPKCEHESEIKDAGILAMSCHDCMEPMKIDSIPKMKNVEPPKTKYFTKGVIGKGHYQVHTGGIRPFTVTRESEVVEAGNLQVCANYLMGKGIIDKPYELKKAFIVG